MSQLLIYGANGYTGELAAREAVARGLPPILGGRKREALLALGSELGLTVRVFDLSDLASVRRGLEGVSAVLHCAGPFVITSRPMVEACLAAGCAYLDITGEIRVFEGVFAQHAKAVRAGVVLLPGVGFDVVPSDSLALRLAEALPGATSLTLAFASAGGSASRGTLKTMIESFPEAGAIRRDGKLMAVPLAWHVREIDFGGRLGRRTCVTIPWGDLSTAWRSTGIPNLRVYTGMPPSAVRRLRWLNPLLPVAGWGPIKRRLQRAVDRRAIGPSAEARATARTYLWGEIEGEGGRRLSATLETPEAYAFTAVSAIACARKVLAGEVKPGAWTAAQAFGSRFVDGLPGVAAGPIVEA
jgi:saccharopine dehydrogenase (NAD+, L-lysine-forming)